MLRGNAELLVNQLYFPSVNDYTLACVLSRMDAVLEPARALLTHVRLTRRGRNPFPPSLR
jgi:hypothetical protein